MYSVDGSIEVGPDDLIYSSRSIKYLYALKLPQKVVDVDLWTLLTAKLGVHDAACPAKPHLAAMRKLDLFD